MKTLKILLFVATTFFIVSCQRDETAQQGTVQFAFTKISSGSDGGRKQTDQIPDGASLIISLTKSNGDSVFSWKKMDLLKVGDQFITSPLPLLQGSYVITDFMILGADNTVLFIAPKQGSTLAALVSKPLPISFSVNTNSVSNVAVEVVDANHKSPQDFGYVSFPIKVIPGSGFAVSTFVADDNGQTNLTTAKAYILQGVDTILKQDLKATINNLNWINQDTTYRLVIIKDGYARYEKDFTLVSLTNQLNNQPLAIVLKPAFTMSWTPYRAGDDFLNFQINGKAGAKIYVDWGDGSSIQTIQFPNGDEIHHTYASPVKYFFSVTGDVKDVESFGMFEQIAIVDTMSVVYLSGLKDFELGTFAEYRGHSIDFSHNLKLEALGFDLSNLKIDNLDISHNPKLSTLSIEGLQLPIPILNKVIDDLSNNAYRYNIRNGFINIGNGFGGTGIVGPPSDYQMQELYGLINSYGWSIYPISFH